MSGAMMRFAYADPPYPRMAKKHYGREDNYAGEVDLAALVVRLRDGWPDGWALSTNEPSLPEVIGHLAAAGLDRRRGDYRIMAWVKPFAVFKPGVNPAYAWEPVIVRGGRPRGRKKPTVRDWVSANVTLRRGLVGVKPEPFCSWLFEVLGMGPGDALDDLYPGSGAVTAAWERWSSDLGARTRAV